MGQSLAVQCLRWQQLTFGTFSLMILLRVSVVLLSDISLRKASTKEKMFVDIVQSEKEKCQEKKCKDEAENDTKTFSVLYCIFRS